VVPRHAVAVRDDLLVFLRAKEFFLQEDAHGLAVRPPPVRCCRSPASPARW
jgi:hypothetical protein